MEKEDTMSRNGSGTYSLPAGNPVTTGTTISSTWANGTLSDIATALTQSIAYDGQTTPVANLPMGTYAHTGVGNATVRTMYASAAQVEDGTLNYLTSVAGTNTITATAPVGMTGYVAGQVFRFIAAGANTGACTLNLNSIGAKSLVKTDGSALVSGDIASGAAVQVMYDGTNFQLLSDANGATETVTNLTVTGTLTANNDASISGQTVGKGGGAVATNTSHGTNALLSNTTGNYNTAIGYVALQNNTTGVNNTAIGNAALLANTTGYQNTAVGYISSDANVSGHDITSVGYGALHLNTASNNTAVGSLALRSNTTGTPNDAFGYQALYNNTTGANNVAVGYQSLQANTIGISNAALGYAALNANVSGNSNTGIGNLALFKNTASNNTAVGNQALVNNTTGSPNDAFGYQALYANTTGANNVAVGYQSLNANTTGTNNTAVGYTALLSSVGTTGNTFVGKGAGYSVTSGSWNIGLGNQAMGGSAVTGADNIAIGAFHDGDVEGPLYALTSGNKNIAFGTGALRSVTTGSENIAIGYKAGYFTTALTTGFGNICIGSAARTSSAGATNQIVLGYTGVGQGDNYVSIGIGGTSYIYNKFDTNATWTKASDERIKANIQDLPIGLDFINELKVKSYNWKPSNEIPTDIIGYSEENTQDTEAVMYGMIAQDVKAAMDKLGYEHFGGWNVREADGLQGLSNEMFVLPLINAVKELSAQNADLLARIEALESK